MKKLRLRDLHLANFHSIYDSDVAWYWILHKNVLVRRIKFGNQNARLALNLFFLHVEIIWD